jgi:hypothetical protein
MKFAFYFKVTCFTLINLAYVIKCLPLTNRFNPVGTITYSTFYSIVNFFSFSGFEMDDVGGWDA